MGTDNLGIPHYSDPYEEQRVIDAEKARTAYQGRNYKPYEIGQTLSADDARNLYNRRYAEGANVGADFDQIQSRDYWGFQQSDETGSYNDPMPSTIEIADLVGRDYVHPQHQNGGKDAAYRYGLEKNPDGTYKVNHKNYTGGIEAQYNDQKNSFNLGKTLATAGVGAALGAGIGNVFGSTAQNAYRGLSAANTAANFSSQPAQQPVAQEAITPQPAASQPVAQTAFQQPIQQPVAQQPVAQQPVAQQPAPETFKVSPAQVNSDWKPAQGSPQPGQLSAIDKNSLDSGFQYAGADRTIDPTLPTITSAPEPITQQPAQSAPQSPKANKLPTPEAPTAPPMATPDANPQYTKYTPPAAPTAPEANPAAAVSAGKARQMAPPAAPASTAPSSKGSQQATPRFRKF